MSGKSDPAQLFRFQHRNPAKSMLVFRKESDIHSGWNTRRMNEHSFSTTAEDGATDGLGQAFFSILLNPAPVFPLQFLDC